MERREVVDEILRLGMKCNFTCPFCNIVENESLPELDLEGAKELADRMKVLNDDVSISGGEPTLYPYLVELVRYMKSKKFRVRLQTNASLVTKELARELREARLDAVFINLPSHSPEAFSELTGTSPEMFCKVVGGIRTLIEHDLEVIINLVINELNYSGLADYLRFVHTQFPEVRVVNFSVIQPHGRAARNSYLVPDYNKIRPHLREAIKVSEELGLTLINPFCGMPACSTYGILPLEQNSECLAAVQMRATEFVSGRSQMEKVFGCKTHVPSCVDCYLKNFCLGPWKAYYEIKGDIFEPPFRALRFWPEG